jgi:hypothetical protein
MPQVLLLQLLAGARPALLPLLLAAALALEGSTRPAAMASATFPSALRLLRNFTTSGLLPVRGSTSLPCGASTVKVPMVNSQTGKDLQLNGLTQLLATLPPASILMKTRSFCRIRPLPP